ncbi:CBS domain-containing protein [Nocardia amikacinitolerans]|uniref:CBS domain-containing protein n=1 Tax=Nocardia amikacinitolerans TaxID=756689 RepID=A0A285KWS9_9NOCA|nr:CBS domain-containing protein [Nocardia amikacinitolerans]MCP2276100.1 CBS domain-containing protein [Nocardia amikacinitolerans]MCP2294371.1 CBS domain-containing protein [Nocardia amikacinitolerans]MCP2314733.1 CBS domain-containing protein [Nocardia amikacinitolerans]SNY77120.1 CBS domain-containing protein [Nocardia amikacinitolerans]
MTTAGDIMTAGVHCIRAGDTVAEAADQMAELDIGALPICGEDNRLHGMLTDRDIVVKVVAARKDPQRVLAGELAGGVPYTVDVTDGVRKVVSLMAQHQVRRIPVLDRGRLVGIIAQADVATALGNAQAGNMVEAVSLDF